MHVDGDGNVYEYVNVYGYVEGEKDEDGQVRERKVVHAKEGRNVTMRRRVTSSDGRQKNQKNKH